MEFLHEVEREARGGGGDGAASATAAAAAAAATAAAEAGASSVAGLSQESKGATSGEKGSGSAGKPKKKKPVVCIVMGMAGSGKTTLLQRLNLYTTEMGIRSYFINLDPAVKQVPFGASIDIRDTVNYKEVMSQYGLGPNGAITTSLNLFATRFDQVLDLLEKRSDELEYVFIDTPGQIEVFTWSASGQIITETLASAFPTTLVYVVDTPRTSNPTTFMSNMLYACSVLYKSRLPLVLALNKSDILSPKFALEWMSDFEKLQEALDTSGDESYMNSLNRSLALVLDEFYNALNAVGVSAASGDGMPALFKALDNAGLEFERDYLPDLQRRVAEAKARQETAKQRSMEKLMADIAISSGDKVPPGGSTGKPPVPGGGSASARGASSGGKAEVGRAKKAGVPAGSEEPLRVSGGEEERGAGQSKHAPADPGIEAHDVRDHQEESPSTAVVTAPQEACEGGRGAGVLLYYKYVDLGEERRSAVKDWYLQHCGAEGLRGRVRVALDGVNCTLGGSLAALRRHIVSVEADTILQGRDIDFKLSASRGARNSQAALESGFTTLSVKAVKEVVSLGVRGAGLSHLQGGRHVSPQEFHRFLRDQTARQLQRATHHGGHGEGERLLLSSQPATDDAAATATPTVAGRADPPAAIRQEQGNGEAMPSGGAIWPSEGYGEARERVVDRRGGGGGGAGEDDVDGARDAGAPASSPPVLSDDKEAVLLDVRNVYETSIGHFSAEGVERLDPKTRQFSELPKWVDENVERLRGKRVLMYCTGGVRCEMASALIRRHCNADASGTEILQLSGGIERYLQAYPPGREDPMGEGAGCGSSDAALEEGRQHQRASPDGAANGDGRESIQSSGGRSLGGGAEEGFFVGKNFVFDERVSVPESPAGGTAIGRCLVCESPWDDYGSRSRCTRCRMLVLVCDACVFLLAAGNGGCSSNGDGRDDGGRNRRAPL
eukprot:g8723.t1